MRVRSMTLLLCLAAVACGGPPNPPRPLKCPVVTCKAANCKTPEDDAPYMSDEWRCVSVSAPG